MRGKAPFILVLDLRQRITPAYAGKRHWACQLGLHRRDHPRLCGEKRDRPIRQTDVEGSPPPMRGKGFSVFKNFFRLGITPAYAGKS